MLIENIDITAEERNKLLKIKHTTYINTKFGFLKTHMGIRSSKMHLLIANAGGGKSTLVRSITPEIASQCRTLVVLSEESVDDFRLEYSTAPNADKTYKNLRVMSELDKLYEYPTENYEGFYNRLEQVIHENNIEVLIYDNITTSNYYGETPNQQAGVAKRLKQIGINCQCAVFLVAHTRSGISEQYDGIIEETDIRGSKSVPNLCEFVYILQRFSVGKAYFPTIRVRKYRGYSPIMRLFGLTYDFDSQTYTSDQELPFEKFKEVYQARNKL